MEHWVKRNTHTKSPPPWADVCSTVHTHSKSDYHWSANRYKISQKPGHKPHQLVPGSSIISIKCTGNLDSPGLQGYQSSQDTSVCKAIVLSGTVHEILHLQQDVALFLSNLVIIMSLQWTANLRFTDFDASNESGYVVWFHLSHLSMWCYTIEYNIMYHASPSIKSTSSSTCTKQFWTYFWMQQTVLSLNRIQHAHHTLHAS